MKEETMKQGMKLILIEKAKQWILPRASRQNTDPPALQF
jgi:hypothetical protein